MAERTWTEDEGKKTEAAGTWLAEHPCLSKELEPKMNPLQHTVWDIVHQSGHLSH